MEKILLFNQVFSDCRYICLSCEDIARQSCAMVRRWPIFASNISDLHSKFALRPHHVRKYMVDIQSATAKNKRGKNDRNHSCEIECPHLLYTQGGHNECDAVIFVRAVYVRLTHMLAELTPSVNAKRL